MKRRRRRITDPTAESVYSGEFLDLLDEVLAKMPVWEGQALRQHLGLVISTPTLNWLETLTSEQRELLLKRGMSRLLHPSRVLEVARLLDSETMARILGARIGDYATHCERHGTYSLVGGCAECPCSAGVDRLGRPRLYCSNACRQAAHRRRRKEAC